MDAAEVQTGNRKPYRQYEIKDGIVFLIELTPALVRAGPHQPVLFEILSSINDLMSEIIITMRNTGIGIYIYNCDPSPALTPMSTSVSGFHRLLKLHPMTIGSMKRLNDIVSDHKRGIRSVQSLFKVSAAPNTEALPQVLGLTLQEMVTRPFFNRKKLLWLTTNDKPYTSKATGENVYRVINDFYNYGYFIRPIFIGDGSTPFDMSLFRDMFLNTNFLDAQTRPGQFHGFDKNSLVFAKAVMADEIRSHIFRVREVRRVKFSCNLILSDGKAIGGRLGCTITGYTLFSRQFLKNDFLIHINGEYPQRVFTEQQDVMPDEAPPSADSITEARKGVPLNGGQVLLLQEKQMEFMNRCVFDHGLDDPSNDDDDDDDDDDDNDDSDAFEDAFEDADQRGEDVLYSERPFLKLLGFRSIDSFTPGLNMGAATFVTADLHDGTRTKAVPGGFQNSYTTFSSLYSSCRRLGKYAVLFGAPRKFQEPALYALYPTRTTNSSMNPEISDREFPEGFLLFRTPFLDDVRNLPRYFIADDANTYDTSPDLPAELVHNYQQLLSQFFIAGYSPLDTPNPSLNFFYKVMKHQLLQIALPESEQTLDKNDITYMRLAQLRHFLVLDKDKSDLVQHTNAAIQAHAREAETQAYAMPRELTSNIKRGPVLTGPISIKKPALGLVMLDDDTLIEAWKSNDWRHITVALLREYRSRHADEIPSAKTKQEFIDNICRYLAAKNKP